MCTPRRNAITLASTETKIMPCSTSTEASGNPNRRWSSPPPALMPPSSRATGMTASGLCRARKATRDHAGEAVAGGEIGVGAALHGGHFDHAGEPAAPATMRTSRPTPDRPPWRRGRCRRQSAPRTRTWCERSTGRPGSRQRCRHQGPMHVVPGMVPIMLAAPISLVDGLFRLAGSASAPRPGARARYRPAAGWRWFR